MTLDKLQLGNVTDYVLDDRELLEIRRDWNGGHQIKSVDHKEMGFTQRRDTVEDLSSGDIIVDADGAGAGNHHE